MAADSVAASLGVLFTGDSASLESAADRGSRAVQRARSVIDREAQQIARSWKTASAGSTSATSWLRQVREKRLPLARPLATRPMTRFRSRWPTFRS